MIARRPEFALQSLILLVFSHCLRTIIPRHNYETVHIARFEVNSQLVEFAELRIRVQDDLRANQKPGELCRADSFDGIAKCAFAPRTAVMPSFESLELHGKEKPRDRPKLVKAAPEKRAAGLNKDVSVCVHDSARKPADLRMQERLSAANPDDRSGAAPHSVQAIVGGQ